MPMLINELQLLATMLMSTDELIKKDNLNMIPP